MAGTLKVADWPKSEESFDWLGHGIYFWEHGLHRAQQWAKEKANRDGEEPFPERHSQKDLRHFLDRNSVLNPIRKLRCAILNVSLESFAQTCTPKSMGNSESYKEAMRRIEKYGETPARERFAHNVKIGLINETAGQASGCVRLTSCDSLLFASHF